MYTSYTLSYIPAMPVLKRWPNTSSSSDSRCQSSHATPPSPCKLRLHLQPTELFSGILSLDDLHRAVVYTSLGTKHLGMHKKAREQSRSLRTALCASSALRIRQHLMHLTARLGLAERGLRHIDTEGSMV